MPSLWFIEGEADGYDPGTGLCVLPGAAAVRRATEARSADEAKGES
jgi:hypothetical protein